MISYLVTVPHGMEDCADFLPISNLIDNCPASVQFLRHGRNRTETYCNHNRIRIQRLFLPNGFQNDLPIFTSERR